MKISKDNTSQYENNRTYPALLLGHVDGAILADLVLDNLALPLVDDLALCLGVGGAHLLHDGGALVLVAGGALLVELYIGAGGVGHLLALLPGDGLILDLGHLLAHLLGHLPALWLGGLNMNMLLADADFLSTKTH